MAKKKASKSRKKVARKSRAKSARARKPPARGSSIEALARKIVKVTSLAVGGEASPTFPLRELYTDDAVSEEASGAVSRGLAQLEDKLKRWEEMQSGTKWKARNVWTRGNTICIEWDAEVNLRDGRTVSLREIGVHEIRGGKIAAERFYYNPMALAPPATT